MLSAHLGLVDRRGFARCEEILQEAREERSAIPRDPCGETRSGLGIQSAIGVVVGFHQVRRHRARKHELRDALLPVVGDVASEFAAAHREADEGDVGEIEGVDQLREVGCERVVLVPAPRLRRLAEPAAVIGDDAISGLDERRNLTLPRPPAERPSVNQDHRFAGAVVLIVEFDRRIVFGTNGDKRHGVPQFFRVAALGKL